MTPPVPVRLTGLLVCADEHDAALVAELLPAHLAATRAETGCVAFEVRPTSDPLVWEVAEEFTDAAAFARHQERASASPWGRRTAHVERRYVVSGLPEEPGPSA